ncbi:uncharacterized protein LOC120681018 [Panicum virgatum]|uniref:uncharacterized protein LOC120681018 n=1 Tax=Panicum virgatum TaxID=38727 RepID=UPI0019D535E0|nr:uncharacterized protein LOC120681018 [Panicum virgatum]
MRGRAANENLGSGRVRDHRRREIKWWSYSPAFGSWQNSGAARVVVEDRGLEERPGGKAKLLGCLARAPEDLNHARLDLKTANNQVVVLGVQLKSTTDEGAQLREVAEKREEEIIALRIERTDLQNLLAAEQGKYAEALTKNQEMAKLINEMNAEVKEIVMALDQSRRSDEAARKAL